MSSVSSAASTLLSPNHIHPCSEGRGPCAVGGNQKGDDAQEVIFPDEVHVGEDDGGIVEAEDVQPQ